MLKTSKQDSKAGSLIEVISCVDMWALQVLGVEVLPALSQLQTLVLGTLSHVNMQEPSKGA